MDTTRLHCDGKSEGTCSAGSYSFSFLTQKKILEKIIAFCHSPLAATCAERSENTSTASARRWRRLKNAITLTFAAHGRLRHFPSKLSKALLHPLDIVNGIVCRPCRTSLAHFWCHVLACIYPMWNQREWVRERSICSIIRSYGKTCMLCKQGAYTCNALSLLQASGTINVADVEISV